MADRLSSVTTALKQYIPYITTANAERVINEIIQESAYEWPIYDVVRHIPVAADVSEYKMPEHWMHIRKMHYVKASGNTPVEMICIEKQNLDRDQDGWREATSGDPIYYYVAGSDSEIVIGVTPPPDTTFTSGYPYLRALVITAPPTFTTNMPVPFLGPSGKRYLAAAAAERYAEEMNSDSLGTLRPLAQEYKTKVSRWFHKLSTENRPSINVQSRKPRVV